MSKNHFVLNSVGNLVSSRIDSKGGRMAAEAAASVAVGLLASRAEIFGMCAPFGVAAVAASTGPDSLFMLLGAAVGYLLPYGMPLPAKYIAAAALVVAFKWLLSGLENVVSHPAAKPLIAAGCILAAGMAVVIHSGLLFYDTALCISETLLCGCSVVFLQSALPYLKAPSRIWGLSQQELVGVTVSFCILLLSLSGVGAGGLSFGRVLGVLAILVAARYGGAAGGSVTGAAIGMIMSFGDKSMSHILMNFGFGGLIAGVFSPLGRFGCAAAFILANAVSGIYLDSVNLVTELYEVMIATVAFMLLPERAVCRLSMLFVPVREKADPGMVQEAVAGRLTSAADTLQEVSRMVGEVTDRLRKIKNDDISVVFQNASDCTCARCGMRMFCWETAYNDTMNVMNDLSPVLRKNGRLERADVPPHFSSRCCKLGEYLVSVNSSYAEYSAKKCEELKSAHLRNVLGEQFTGMASLLRNMAGELSRLTRFEYGSEDKVRAAFASCGVEVGRSCCRSDMNGRITVEADVPSAARRELGAFRQLIPRLASRLSESCGIELCEPELSETGGNTRMVFRQKPPLTVKFGQSHLRKNGECLCGDSHEAFVDRGGRGIMIISDGMGCGGSAAVDSTLATKFMSRLLQSGFDFDAALEMVNSALMLKSSDESFATLDIACIDLFTGGAELLKAGAPPSYLRRCGRVERVSPSSMPAGIVREVKFERRRTRLHSGDAIALVSDGAVSDDDAWLIRKLEDWDGENPQSFAQDLAQSARELREDGHDDDITVLVARIV